MFDKMLVIIHLYTSVCVCVSNLECALESAECVHLLIDDGIFVSAYKWPAELVVSDGLILANQRHSSLLQLIKQLAHLIHRSCIRHTRATRTVYSYYITVYTRFRFTPEWTQCTWMSTVYQHTGLFGAPPYRGVYLQLYCPLLVKRLQYRLLVLCFSCPELEEVYWTGASITGDRNLI